MLVLPTGWRGSTQYKKLYILSCFTFVKDFHACQLAETQAFMFILAQPKVPANPSFLLFVTSPTVAQETQNLKIQGLPC